MEVKITKKQVQETDFFKKLDPVVKKITLNKQVPEINHGVNVCLNTSFEKWEKQTGSLSRIKEIVKEILNSYL